MRFRYSKWKSEGKHQVFNPESGMDQFINHLFELNSIPEALSRMLRNGFMDSDANIKGLDAILEELRNLKDRIFKKHNIQSAKNDLESRLQEFLNEKGPSEKLSAYLQELKKRNIFHEFQSRMDDIRSFEDSMDRYYLRFNGSEALFFEEAMEIFKKLHKIEEIEKALQSEDLEKIDADELKEILGKETMQSFNFLRHVVHQVEALGYIKNVAGKMELTPRGIRRIGEKALRDIFSKLFLNYASGLHPVADRGKGQDIEYTTKSYEFGDDFNIDVSRTIKNSLLRGNSGGRIQIHPQDFEIYETDTTISTTTVLLIDMSWSMSWGNKFAAAKKVGIALEELIRTKFVRDRFYIVGFFTVAVELKPHQLPTLDLSLADPFTNMQDAFLLAEKLLSKHNDSNRQIILVTDGQPTAYTEGGILQVEWPVLGISPRAFDETLRAVHLLTKHKIRINTFMLDDNPVLKEFIEEMSRINCGRVFFTTPEEIGSYLLVDYIAGRRRRIN